MVTMDVYHEKERCKLLAVRGVYPSAAGRTLPKASLHKVSSLAAYRDFTNRTGEHIVEIKRTKYFHIGKALSCICISLAQFFSEENTYPDLTN